MIIGCLGPAGSFTEQAAAEAAKSFSDQNVEIKVCPTIEDVFTEVANDTVDCGVVPIDNSTEGTVNATVDSLIFRGRFFIKREIALPIVQNMLTDKNAKPEDIRQILSHPQGIAQGRKFLMEHYPQVHLITVSSTSEAAKIISEKREGYLSMAAICNSRAAEIYGLKIMHAGIQENLNRTHFVEIGKADTAEPRTGCKTSIAFSVANKPGTLYKILDIFSLWDLNMTKIVSRPMRGRPGEHVFFIDIENYENPHDIKDALTMVQRKTTFYKNLGTYPISFI